MVPVYGLWCSKINMDCFGLLDMGCCCTTEQIPAHLLCPAAVEPAAQWCPGELVSSPWIVSVPPRSPPPVRTGPRAALWSPTGSPATEQGFPEIHNHRFRNTDSVFIIKNMNTNIPQMCPLLSHRPQSQISAAFPHNLYQLLLSGTTRTQI